MADYDYGDAGQMLDVGRAILAEQPFNGVIGAELVGFAPGEAELRLSVREELRQQFGLTHGGVVSYLADNTLTFAGGSVLGPTVLTAEYKLSFVRPAIGEDLVARASVVHAGRRQAVCRCDVFDVTDGQESLCATALGTVRAVQDSSTETET